LGPLYYGKENEVVLRVYNQKNISESVQSIIDAEIKDLINEALNRCQKLLHDNAAKVKVMAELLLANETIYSDEINLVMEGKSAKDITAAIEARKEKQTKIANGERINNLIEQINPLLERSMEIAKLHLAENLVSEDHIKTLEKNCELAREYIRQTGTIPLAIPTIDFESLEKYPSIVAIEKPAELAKETASEPEQSAAPAKKKPAAKKPATKKTTTKAKTEENGDNTKTASHDEVPAHE